MIIPLRLSNLAEKYRTPVVLLIDEITAHTREKIIIPNPDEFEVFNRIVPTMPPEWYKPFEETVRGVPPMPSIGSGLPVPCDRVDS